MGTFIVVTIFVLAVYFILSGIAETRDKEALDRIDGFSSSGRTGNAPVLIGLILMVVGIIMVVL